MKRPIIFLTASFVLGILLSENVNINYLLVVGLSIPILFFLKRKWDIVLLLSCILAIFLTDLENNKIRKISESDVSKEYIIEEVQNEEYGKSYTAKELERNSYKARIRIYGETDYRLGDIIHIKGKRSLPEENSNPGLFNYKNFLKSKQVFALIDAEDFNTYKTGKTNNVFLKLKYAILEQGVELFDNNFEAEHSNFLKTVFLGIDSMNDSEKEQIRGLGIAHLLAISGFHISLIYAFLHFLLIRANLSKYTNMIVIVVSLWLYAYLLSWVPSVFRVVFMITVLLISSRFYLPWDRMNILFFSLFINLFLNPFAIYDIGLQFSYAAAFIIIAVIPRFNLEEEHGLLSLIKFSAVIYIFLLPIQLYYFNEIQLGFLLGNIIVVPLFILVIIAAALYILFGFIPLAGSGLRFFVEWSLNLFDLVIDGASLFASTVTVPSIPITGIVFFYLFCFLYFKHRKDLLRNKNIIIISLLIIFFYEAVQYNFLHPVTITMIDIGQGESVLIKNREETVLVDTGGSFWEKDLSGERILKPALLKKGLRSIDYLILSHFDEDHAGNLEMIMKEFRPKAVIGRAGGKEILRKKYNIDVPYIELGHSALNFNGFKIINYPAENLLDENNKSLVFKLIAHDTKILFPGDIEKEAEEKYLEHDIESDILKVPHHGSKTSSTEAFLDKVNPRLGIISAGRKNMYGFPHKEVIERYRKKEIPILRTDLQGEIEITIHRYGFTADTYWPKKSDIRLLKSVLLWTILFYVLLNERTKNELYRWSERN